MRVAIFGGSFNPVHNGHVAICDYIVTRDLADRILVVPCFAHVFDKPLAPFADRLAMCRLAFDGTARVEISTMEKDLGGKSVTARTLRTLQTQRPHDDLWLVVGSDIVTDELDRWAEADWMRRHARFLEIPRGAQGPIPDISATEIRQRCGVGRSLEGLVPVDVAAYLSKKRVYNKSH